jgi:hypothetical protein
MDRRAFLATSAVTASGLALRAAAAATEGPFGATATPVPVPPAQGRAWPILRSGGDALDLRRPCGPDGASLAARSLRAGGGVAERWVENR